MVGRAATPVLGGARGPTGHSVTPVQRPDGSVVTEFAGKNALAAMLIFDGDCGFCTASATWVERRAQPATSVVPFQDLDDATLAEFGVTRDDVQSAAYWIGAGPPRRGHRAIAAALRDIGGRWGIVGRVVDAAPLRPLASVAYALVARFRHRLPGGTPSCRPVVEASPDADPTAGRR